MVLLEEFTVTWSGRCPIGTTVIEKMLEKYDNIIVLAYHNDEMKTEEGNELIEKVQPVYPQAMIDRFTFPDSTKLVMFPAHWEEKYRIRSQVKPSITIEIQPDYNEKSRQVDLRVIICTKEELSGKYHINVVLTEDGLSYPQKIFERQEKVIDPCYHKHVVRKMITGATGELLNKYPLPDGVCIMKNYSFKLKPSFNVKKCNIVVFVHEIIRDGIEPVLQAAKTRVAN